MGQSVRQLSFVALSMHRDAMAGLSTTDGTDLADRDEQADRLAGEVGEVPHVDTTADTSG